MRRARLAVACAVLVLLAACSPEAKVKALPPGARVGGHLNVGILSPRSIAPWLTSTLDPYGALVVTTMCDQILSLDPATAELAPSIAASFRFQEAKHLVVKLRRGVRFPDGSSVSGDDIADSISRAANSEFASPAADVLKLVDGYDFLADLKSADETDPKLRERLGGVLIPDPSSMEIILSKNSPDAFRFLAHPLASVVPSTTFKKDPAALERDPGCVGPYRLTEPWQPGAPAIHLVRSGSYEATNEAYTVGGRGLLDSIDFKIYPDRDALYGAYRAGEVDVAYLPAAKLAEARTTLGDDVVVAASPTIEYIGLPTTKPPFDNPDVRIALSAALDRQALVRGLQTPLHPLGRFLPPTLGEPYADGSKVSCRTTAKLEGDLEFAKQKLADAKTDLAGTTIKLAFNDEFDNRQLVEAVAKQWEAAFGLKVELVPTPWEKILDAAGTTGGIVDPFRVSWSPEVSDPTQYIRPLFHSESLQQTNWSRLTMRPIDFQLDSKTNEKVDADERASEMLTTENFVCNAMPMIPVAQGGFAYAIRQQRVASAAGTFTDRASGAPLLRELYLKA